MTTPPEPRAAVRTRALEHKDAERMRQFFYRLSPETVYRRFLTSYSDPDQLRLLMQVDHVSRVAVAAIDEQGEIVGIGRYGRLHQDPTTAEIAVVVQDSYQGRGLGTRLLAEISDLARTAGVRHLVATTLADNRTSLRILRRVFPVLVLTRDGSQIEIVIDLEPKISTSA